MALTVTQANPTQTITGVTTAQPNLSISGVTSASTPVSNLSVASPTGTNYNPQQTSSVNTVQPVAKTSTVMPNTQKAGGVLQPSSSPSSVQTFKLGDGSTYDINGNQLSGPTSGAGVTNSSGITQNNAPLTLDTPAPSTTTTSNSLTNDTGYSDVLKLLGNNLSNMDKMFSNLASLATVSPEEKAQQEKVANDQAGMTALGYQAQGLYNPNNQTIALPFLTGQAQNKMVGAGIQSQLDQAVLNYMQGNRQFAFNSASQVFDASQKNLLTALDVYTKAAPQNVGTNYNPSTGQLTAIMRNPFTGATYTANLGNIGAQKSFTSTQIATDPLTGALTFVGTTSDGQVVQQPIGGGNGFSSGGITNPLQNSMGGNFTATGNPQFATTGSLLSNWTSGGSSMPGQGYQNAVYQTFAKETGMQIDANTPTSTLISNIPALAKGIAVGEGWNSTTSIQHVTNNPGNILWANQPNATPYKASNGYTYAKFNTEQDGWNAMYTLLAKKLGATQTVNPNQAAQQLPPALQGAVKQLQDGTKFFDAGQLTSAQIPMAQAWASQTGIPYVNAGDASKLNNISVTKQNLSEFKQFAQDSLYNAPGFISGTFKNIGSIFGGSAKTKFESYRTTALNSIQALAGGEGSGFRLTQGEINTAIDNLPTIWDSEGQATAKLNALNNQLDKWTAQILPNWKPSSLSVSQQPVDYTATLNNLMMGGM